MKRSERPGRGERRVAGSEGPVNGTRGRTGDPSGRSTKLGPKVQNGKGAAAKKRPKSLRGGRIGFASRKRKRPKQKADNDNNDKDHNSKDAERRPRSGTDRPFTPPGNEAAKTSSLMRTNSNVATSDGGGGRAQNGAARGGSKRSQRVAERAAAVATTEEPPEPEPFKRPKILLSLQRKEIEADFLAISGRRAPKRKRKSKAKLGTGHLSLCRSLSFKY